MSLQSFRELDVWQVAFRLAITSYELARRLPVHERFGLASQLRRAATSVPANIAEGYGRAHRGDYLHHLSIASGSLKELETHLLLLNALGYVSASEIESPLAGCARVGAMLTQLQRALRAS